MTTTTKGKLSDKELRRLFDFNDKGGKKNLTKDELRALIEQIRRKDRVQAPIRQQVIDAIFTVLDPQSTGLVSWEQFQAKFDTSFYSVRSDFYDKESGKLTPQKKGAFYPARSLSYLPSFNSADLLNVNTPPESVDSHNQLETGATPTTPIADLEEDIIPDNLLALSSISNIKPPLPAKAVGTGVAAAAISSVLPSETASSKQMDTTSKSGKDVQNVRVDPLDIRLPKLKADKIFDSAKSAPGLPGISTGSVWKGRIPVEEAKGAYGNMRCPHCGNEIDRAVIQKHLHDIGSALTKEDLIPRPPSNDYIPVYGPFFYSGVWEFGRVVGAVPPSFFQTPYNVHTWSFALPQNA